MQYFPIWYTLLLYWLFTYQQTSNHNYKPILFQPEKTRMKSCSSLLSCEADSIVGSRIKQKSHTVYFLSFQNP